ncbi:MAG: hypothetical protein IJU45_05340 [Clostridia bacterium]|nr:hypothetical protein [Clostridia bacterium]
MKKLIASLLCAVILFTGCSFASFAYAAQPAAEDISITPEIINQGAEDLHIGDLIRPLKALKFTSSDAFGQSMLKVAYGLADFLIDNIVGIINYVTPSQFTKEEDYKTENFYKGTETFLDSPARGAKWSLGYSSASIQTGNELDGKHYVGGSLSMDKSATSITDDQRVRVVCLNDGSGRGSVAFAALDAFGMSLRDVRVIRERLADFAKENDIISINVTVLHQHSCVDTLGLNGNLLEMILKNPIASILNKYFGTNIKLVNGQNPEFMENLFNVTADAIKDAYNNMEPGRLYYSEIDATGYIYDKREPMVNDNNIHRFRFVPDDTNSKETWLCNAAIHCVGNGAAGTDITGDYPYYMEQAINEQANANFMYYEGAELAITADNDILEEEYREMDRYYRLRYYGKALGELVINSDAPEKEIAPLLNIRFAEYRVPITNEILIFAAKMGLLTNIALAKDSHQTKMEVVTEIGYMELGEDLAIAIVPGELEPSIAYGGTLDKTNSYRGEDWNYPSMQEIVGSDRELVIFGITNDQIGYILTDNDYSSILSGVNEEIVATGDKAGSSTITAFQELVESVK